MPATDWQFALVCLTNRSHAEWRRSIWSYVQQLSINWRDSSRPLSEWQGNAESHSRFESAVENSGFVEQPWHCIDQILHSVQYDIERYCYTYSKPLGTR